MGESGEAHQCSAPRWRPLRSTHPTASFCCCRTLAEAFNLRERGGSGPFFLEPNRQRLAGTAQRQALVLVAAAIREQCQRVRHLVVDLEAVAVGVGKVDRALADMVDRALDLDAAV